MNEIIKETTRYATSSNGLSMIFSAIEEVLADSEVINTGQFDGKLQILPKGIEDPSSYVSIYTNETGIHVSMYDKVNDGNYMTHNINSTNTSLFFRLIEYGSSAILTISYGDRTGYEIGAGFDSPLYISWSKSVPSQTNNAIRIIVGPATDYSIPEPEEKRKIVAMSLDILDGINTAGTITFKDCIPFGWESSLGDEISINSNSMYFSNQSTASGSYINPDGNYRNQEYAENTIIRRYGNLYRPLLFDNVYHIDIQSGNSVKDDNINIADNVYMTSYGLAIRKD